MNRKLGIISVGTRVNSTVTVIVLTCVFLISVLKENSVCSSAFSSVDFVSRCLQMNRLPETISLLELPEQKRDPYNRMDAIEYDSTSYYDDNHIYNYHLGVSNLHDIQSNQESKELESPLRRFEITFLISLPFVFIIHFLVLHLSDVIIERSPSVNVWENHGPFLVTNTIMITSLIAYREARIINEMNEKKTGDAGERRLFLSYTGRF